MARTVRDHRLETRAARSRLPMRAEPYWRGISEGSHLGYYRGSRGGKWVARFRQTGGSKGYFKTSLGEADDCLDADGVRILSYKQAQEAARQWFDRRAPGGGKTQPYTVGDALDEYLAQFTGKSVASTRHRVEVIIRPELGDLRVDQLTMEKIGNWHRARAASPKRLRTSPFADAPNLRELTDDEARRRRKSTANRDLTVLKAALNKAHLNGRVASDEAWRKVRPFPGAEKAKLRYLSDDEARRLVNACGKNFRPMVQAALLTGGRYGELTAIRVQDVDLAAGTVWLMETKAGKPRTVYLEDEGVNLFRQLSAGKLGDELVFPRPDGKRWGASQQARPLERACAEGKVQPRATFHDLRRTYGARLAVRGVPMAVIAEALGHADERITRRHYAHLSPSYVSETIRTHAGGLRIVAPSNVSQIR